MKHKVKKANRRMSNFECQRMESLQAWGFALRATTPQVAFGYDPTGRSVYLKNWCVLRIRDWVYGRFHCSNSI